MGLGNNFKKKIKTIKRNFFNSLIYYIYYHIKINENVVYVESRDGNDFTGNILRIVEEISSGEYGNYKIFVFANKEIHPKIKELQKNYNLKISHITSNTTIASMFLEYAKYIFTDAGIRSKYIKRDGQIFVETWHGTPMKVMGIDNRPEEHTMSPIQYDFLVSDYLLYPSEYTKNKMIDSYLVRDIFNHKILMEGYPRNSVFFDKKRKEEFKSRFNLENKNIFIYMPTFKALLNNRDDKKQKKQVNDFLFEIDENLKDNQILLVKFHPFNQEKINFSKFKKIRPFPQGFETYDILNMADCLITDYSSVFFDFANTRQKIILFTYDIDDYNSYRGTYMSLDDLPFPKVDNVGDLIKELNKPKEYDDTEFLEKFCEYDNPNAVKNLCRHIFNNDKICKEETFEHDKKNILIFAGNLRNNKTTSFLLNFLPHIDREKYNIYVSFRRWDKYIHKNHYEIFDKIPEYVNTFSLRYGMNFTLSEERAFNNFKSDKSSPCPKPVKRMFKRELIKYYDKFPFDVVLNFEPNNINQILLFSNTDKKNVLFYNKSLKDKIGANVLNEVFSNYDIIVVESSDLMEPIKTVNDNVTLVHNIYNHENIINNSNEDILIDKGTLMVSSNPYGIQGVLESKGRKFVSIGDYSKNKNNETLLKAFDKFCDNHPDSQLIIIGNGGKLYNKAKSWRSNLKHWQNVTLIRGISNYLPILKECDLFISSSTSESSFLHIIEADILNIPVIATKNDDFKWMKKYDGFLVEGDEEGLLSGMNAFMEENINLMNIDVAQHNKEALEEFNSLLN